MTFASIRAEMGAYGTPVRVACRVLGVSPAAYYCWLQRQSDPAERTRADLELTEMIRTIHVVCRGV